MRIELDETCGPFYAQIAAQIRDARERGELVPGTRLPGVRDLAAQLGVNRNTVARAYRLLRVQGVLVGHGGQGSRIAAPAGAQRDPSVLAFDPSAAHPLQEPARQGTPRYHPPGGIAAQLQCQGSHDFCLDLLARRLRAARPGVRLTAAPIGSTAGLLALGRGEAQLAGLHLLDTATGEYNRPFVRRLLPGVAVTLITLAEREQGLIVRRGNPLGIRAIDDLGRPGLRYAARQPGSGTQLLLEHLLAQQSLTLAASTRAIGPFATHLAVAAAVAGGRADVGLGLHAAARALDLDFIPLANERYDLAFRTDGDNEAWLGALLEALASPALRADIESLAGYDAAHTAWLVGDRR